MKKRLRRIALVPAILWFSAPLIWAGSPDLESLAHADRVCSSDADCAVVMTDCCGCTLAAVSVGKHAEVRSRIESELGCTEECPILCAAPEVQCVEQLCGLVSRSDTGVEE